MDDGEGTPAAGSAHHGDGSAHRGEKSGAGAAGRADNDGQLSMLRILLVLTMLSGLVDAVCYLGLGRIFTANMTGNIVVLGFAAAGAPGFSVTASLTSLLLFLTGAVAGGRLSQHVSVRSRLLTVAIACEAGFVGAAAVVAVLASTVAGGWARYTVIAILAFAMGIRNSVIRHLAIPDMTTTVLTQTLTGLAADSPLAGRDNIRAGRRATAVMAMLIGAILGAALYLHEGAALPLAIAAALAAITATALRMSRAVRYLNKS
jgi:uncharacterized membrane protein YoaK (UPF0700 family)